MKYIVVDVGSSFVKAAVLDLKACRVAKMEKTPSPERLANDNPGIFEIPARVYADLIKNLIDAYSSQYADVAGVILSTQMHGFVYSVPERADIYVSWQDLRSLETRPDGVSHIKHLARIVPPADMAEAGVYIKPSLGLCNLYAMLESDPALPRDGTLYTLGSYVIHHLTGVNVCHLTNAAPLGLVNVKKRKWHSPLLDRLGFGRITLPAIAEDDFLPCGVYGPAGTGLPIYPDYGDQQIAVLGCQPRSGDAIINIATASQVIVPSDKFIHGPYEVRPYFENRFIRTISNMPSGRGLAVLVNLLREAVSRVAGREVGVGEVWSAVLRDFVFDPNGIKVDTTFYPLADRLDGGNIRHIGPDNLTLSSLFSAAFMDMARNYWENIQVIAPADEVERLICSGGVSWKIPPLLQAVAQATGRECRLSPVPDEALSGLFRAALVCGGICDNLDDKPELQLSFE